MKILLLTGLMIIAIGCSSINGHYINHQEHNRLENSFVTDEIYIYKQFAGDDISITRYFFKESNYRFYNLQIHYDGSFWRFMDGTVKIKIDNDIFTKKDNDPHRFTTSKNVHETITVKLSESEFNKLINAKNVGIEYYTDPIFLTSEKLEILKKFKNLK